VKKEQRTLGLYVHIPFCKAKCAYCDFYSLPGAEGRMDEYERALAAHLAETAPRAAQYEVDTVYFGGGTPSFFGAKRLARLMKGIRRQYHLTRDAEVTLEANPDSAGDFRALRELRRAGFNRISLGMQSASDEELREIGRVHTFAQVQAAAAAARKAGFDNLSLDLIYGLPHQTPERWQENLRAAVDLAPQHISCYGLTLEEGTPLYARRESAGLPDDEAQAALYLQAVDVMRHFGYFQYEISNFARPGFESRHNLRYWTLQEYAGFGPGAHSDFGGVRYAYARDLEGYIRGVLDGTPLPMSESEDIPPLERTTEYLMLGLRTVRGICSPAEFERRSRRRFDCMTFPFSVQCRGQPAMPSACPDGSWHLTPRGFLVSNRIIGGVLDALAEDRQRSADAAARGDYRIRGI
jgi:oxygen-independent coproporphyrinogen-3 oxidase